MSTIQHASLAGTDLHEDKRIKQDVHAASAGSNVTLTAPGATLDGVTLAAGDRILLKDQTTASQNGMYVWSGASSTLVRSTDANAATLLWAGFKVFVRSGTLNGATYWTFTTSGTIILETTSLAFAQDANSGSSTFTGEVAGKDFKATGLTGATAGARFGGGTASGAPSTGTWTTGDFVVDQTGYGWVCTAGGTPGTWVATGFHNPMTTQGDLLVGGASGAPSRLPANTSGYVLTANGTGLLPSWQPGASGGGGGTGGTGGSIVPIQTQTPSGVGSVTFGVPTGFRNLRLTLQARGDASAAYETLYLTFNGDTGTNYTYAVGSFRNGGAAAAGQATQANIQLGYVNAATAPANLPSALEVIIPNHAGTTFYKNAFSQDVSNPSTANTGVQTDVFGGSWLNTSAVTTVTLTLGSGNFVSGSTITLWGEADTGPVLLTTNSNLIQETILSSAQASIAISNIPQGYRDLRITLQARGTASATDNRVTLQVNGDTTSGDYDWEAIENNSSASSEIGSNSDSSMQVGRIPSATAPTSAAGQVEIRIANYAGTTFQKTVLASSNYKVATTSTSQKMNNWAGTWKSTAAITSLALALDSGSLDIGTVIRVYGEPAAAGGASVGTGTRTRISANQATTSGTALVVPWNTNDQDSNNQHLLNPTPGALSGTVAKTSGSNALVGTSTTFTTQVAIGQVIQVPGTATEQFVVVAITDNTHLTLSANAANTASGQTATTINTAMVFRQAGMYDVEFGAYMAAISTGTVALQVRLNGATIIAEADLGSVNAAAGYNVKSSRPFQQWDYVEALITQSSGSAVNLTADERTHFAASGRPTVVAAVPYILVQEQHAQNTAGGTFTSGAWQTRALNTVVSDIAAVSALASNQVTLPTGWYRVKARAHGYKVGHHQLRLQNITDATTIVPGDSAYASNASDGWSIATLEGKFQLTGTKALALQHQCSVTEASDGFGTPANLTTEVYSALEVWKEG